MSPAFTNKKAKGDKKDDIKDLANFNLVVATIIATVTFAAAFQVPGEYEDKTGLAVLRKNKHFRTFMIFDCLAFGTSACSNVHPLCDYNISRS